MAKILKIIFSLLLIIVFFNYCKKEAELKPPLSTTTKIEKEPEIEKEEIKREEELMTKKEQKELLVTQRQEEPFKVLKSDSQEENIKKLEFLLDNLSTEKNIIVENEAIESLKPLYLKYGSDALNVSLTSYIETFQAINPKKINFTEKDIERFIKISFSNPGEPREWGRLIINFSPRADLAWIRGLGKVKHDEKIEISSSPCQVPLIKGLYEVIVYYENLISGNTNVTINSIKDDKKGTTLEYSFQ